MTILISLWLLFFVPTETQLLFNEPQQILSGKQIMEQKCLKCHELKKLDDFTLAEWTKVLPKMSRKAKLSESETTTLAAYVQNHFKK